MTLIPLHATSVTLPDIKLKAHKISGNTAHRFGFVSQPVDVTIFDSERNGWYLLQTNLPSPYNRLYLRKPSTRSSIPSNQLCLEPTKSCNLAELNHSIPLRWVQHPSLNDTRCPDEVVLSWTNGFNFREDRPELDLPGLRTPQLGALHAVSAYFSMPREQEPATVVLPTGTGKTETMLATLVYRQLPKLLVLVPSNSLRDQITGKFQGLGYLPKLGVVSLEVALPWVTLIKTGIKSITEAEQILLHSNVIVATASVLNSSDQNAVDRLCAGISDLFIDEAHHVSASTWTKIRDRFEGKRVVQFTATPFRNDGSSLGGRVIFNFTMGEAQKAKYFRNINLIPIEKYFMGEGDDAIAHKAVEKLRADLAAGLDHLLMARVESKARANVVACIYEQLAPDLNPLIVYSEMSSHRIGEALSALFSRQSRIVVCVNMLGEGFDLPNLKIAAIHDIHKSLAITLQFIGRFTRHCQNVGDASVVVNVAEPEVEAGLEHLYAQGADWDKVLRRLSEDRIGREIRLQEVVERLKNKGNLHHQLSLWNLRPSFSAMLFNTSCNTWEPDRFVEILPKDTEHWFAISEEENMLVVLVIYQAPVKWGNYKDLSDSVYKLLIVHWDKVRSGLFIYANDYKWFRVEKLAELLCNGQCEIVSGSKVFNVFNGLKYPLVRNLGASQVGAISFTQYFGPNVTEGLSLIESAQSYLSNLAGLGYDNGDKVIWGCSQKKGKIWSVNSGSISDWLVWGKIAWDKVSAGDVDEANITRDFLRPKKLSSPYSEYAIAVQWGEHIQADPEDRVMILFGEREVPLYLVDLKIVSQGPGLPYHIAVSDDGDNSIYEFTIDGTLPAGYSYDLLSGKPVSVKRGNADPKPIGEYLTTDPWIIQYANGSHSYNRFLIEIPETVGEFTADLIDRWDWSGVDIKKESMGKNRNAATVQWRAFEQIRDLYDVVVNDDGSGEAADLVGLNVTGDEIHLGLVHCKYSGEVNPGGRVKDLYEVCGQAQKSIRWKHAGISRLYDRLKERERIWKSEGASRFLKGTLSDLSNIKRRSRTASVKLQVYVIQPGLRKDAVTSDMLRVLGSTSLYLKNTAKAELIVAGS
ncbi:DEAD/DEAH box helicase [Geomonas oryzae]|uniref:DEAD/DEAH box helicase n=1 Tax=Geomonas oryzae TaxID=2364273 RepID=UPI00100B2222|nr:DEAD/DEAH box helicase family protein [Geomonas oryzae]